jgi:hypothetical protein
LALLRSQVQIRLDVLAMSLFQSCTFLAHSGNFSGKYYAATDVPPFATGKITKNGAITRSQALAENRWISRSHW